jgi:RNA polymerase sigma-70 factor (ECF subfamily)
MEEQFNLDYLVERVALFSDEQAFEKIFFFFNDDLFNLAFSLLRSKEQAEEIISDTFVNVWRNRSRLPEIGNIKVYLFVAVKNLCITHLSRNKQKNIVTLDDAAENLAVAGVRNPEEMFMSKQMLQDLQAAIAALPPKCRLIFKLAREDGFRYKEIAQILNISVRTVDAQMAIAAKRIARAIRNVNFKR